MSEGLNVVALTSARSEGTTTLAAALAGVLSRGGRTLLVDLDLSLAEVGTLLNLDDSRGVYHLAYRTQLAPVGPVELDETVRWHEGLAVLSGIADEEDAWMVRNHFVTGLLDAAAKRFAWAVLDLGRVRVDLPWAISRGVIIWVVSPSPLGLAAFDRRFRQMKRASVPWLPRVRVVLNQVAEDSLGGVTEFLRSEYGVSVVGAVPYEPGFWRSLQLSHSIQPLSVDARDEPRYVSWFGRPALRARRALERLADALRADTGRPTRVGLEA